MKQRGIWIVYSLICIASSFQLISAEETSEDRQRDTFTLYDRNRRELDWDRQHGGHRGFGRSRQPDTTNSPHNEQAWIYGSDRRDERSSSRNVPVNFASRAYSAEYGSDYAPQYWENGPTWDGRGYYQRQNQPHSQHRAVSRPAMPPTE